MQRLPRGQSFLFICVFVYAGLQTISGNGNELIAGRCPLRFRIPAGSEEDLQLDKTCAHPMFMFLPPIEMALESRVTCRAGWLAQYFRFLLVHAFTGPLFLSIIFVGRVLFLNELKIYYVQP